MEQLKLFPLGVQEFFRSLWRMLSRFRAIWIPQGLLIKQQVSRAKLKFTYFRMCENQTINYRPNSDQKVVKILGKIHIDTYIYIYIFKEYIFVAAVYLPSHVGLFCDPVDCSPPGSSAHGIFQARILEWVAIPSPGDLPHPGIELASLALAGRFFYHGAPREAHLSVYTYVSIDMYVYISVSCVWWGGVHKII